MDEHEKSRPLIYDDTPAAQIAAPDHIADARKMVAALAQQANKEQPHNT